ncbi:hypothetical protein ABZZ20_30780 [Streptomyces sp. NPDC006430]|uniref:zinc finger domain-containing protein n=1 Tax=Streptomyces sp. NPDC006430 TaxID=3154299 RepID=UPI0033B6AA65
MSGTGVMDSAVDGVYETLRLYRHGAFGVRCPDCRAEAGALCLARRSVHRGRRRAYRHQLETTVLVPLLSAAV